MPYCLSTSLPCSFEEALLKTASALDKAGLDVIQDLDVQAVIQERIAHEFHPFHVLTTRRRVTPPRGSCPQLPCSVLVRKTGPQAVQISIVPPATSSELEEDAGLRERAGELSRLMHQVVAGL